MNIFTILTEFHASCRNWDQDLLCQRLITIYDELKKIQKDGNEGINDKRPKFKDFMWQRNIGQPLLKSKCLQSQMHYPREY